MKRVVRFAGIGALVGGMALAAVISVNAQRGPMGGGRPDRGPGPAPMVFGVSGLESSWAVLSFDLDASDEVLAEIRKLYQDEWDAVAQLRERMSDLDVDGRREAMSQMQESHAALIEEAKQFLTSEQAKRLDEWHQAQASRRQQWPQQRGAMGAGRGR